MTLSINQPVASIASIGIMPAVMTAHCIGSTPTFVGCLVVGWQPSADYF
jgi:hypothetical protein